MFKLIKVFTLAFSLITTTLIAGEVPEISQQQLLEALTASNNNIVLLDVRSKDEYNEGHVAGAINISHNEIKDNIALLTQYKKSKVVVYCRSGRRAAFAQNILSENGFTNLHHLTGDMNAWTNADLPVVVGENKE
jgi:rhodanese-related sulfurtransferase